MVIFAEKAINKKNRDFIVDSVPHCDFEKFLEEKSCKKGYKINCSRFKAAKKLGTVIYSANHDTVDLKFDKIVK